MRTNKSERLVHPHPAAIILYSLKQALLLLIPIVRALFSFPNGFEAWDNYMWVDLLAVGMMFAIGYLRYLATGYRIKRQGIAYQSGLLFHKKGYIPFDEISVMVYGQSVWFRPIRYCTVYIDTDAGKSKSADFTINLSVKQTDILVGKVQEVCRNPQAVKRVCRSSWWEILFLSFISSDSLSGILFISAAISGLGDFISVDISEIIRENFRQLYKLANLLAIKIPPIAAWIAYIMMITWGISFLVHAVYNLRFTVMRQDDELRIRNGIFSKYSHLIKVSKINRIEVRQTLMSKLLGIKSVFVQCCGYGKVDNSLSVLLPAATQKRAEQRLSFLLPEYTFSEREIKPRRKYLGRFLNLPLALMFSSAVICGLTVWLLPELKDTLLFLGIALFLPSLWFLIVKIASYFHTGAAQNGDTYTFFYTYGYRFLMTAVHKEKITRIQLSQSVFQKMIGGCDLLIYTRSEKRGHIRVPNLNRKEAEAFLKLAGR